MVFRNKTTIKTILIILLSAFLLCGCSVNKGSEEKAETMFSIYPVVAEIPVGGTLLLQIQEPSWNAQLANLEWSSSNKQVAEVSSGGNVTAKAEGEAIIEANTGDSGEKSTCRVVVKKDGPILLFSVDENQSNTSDSQEEGQSSGQSHLSPGGGSSQGESEPPDTPDNPGDSVSDSQDGATEDSIPVEYDPQLDIPVEHDPKVDECIWTIRIKDTIEEDVGDSELPMKIIYTLELNAVKKGGKTSKGTYTGTAKLEGKVDTSQLSEKIIGLSEGILTKLTMNIGGTYNADSLTMEVEQYNQNKFTDYGKGSSNKWDPIDLDSLEPGSGVDSEGPEIVDLKPAEGGEEHEVAPLVPRFGMALGFTLFEGTGSFGASSLDVEDIGINYDDQSTSLAQAVTYKLSIGSAGKVHIRLLELGLEDTFDGRISRKPMVSK